MADKELALYVAEQLAPLGETRYIPMMGGWLFYYREKKMYPELPEPTKKKAGERRKKNHGFCVQDRI